jgi:predicted nucleic acid-binding Zn ribbon protein
VLSRPTITALRARHTAFRIALDILYPRHTMPPQLPVPAERVSPFSETRVVVSNECVEEMFREGDRMRRRHVLFARAFLISIIVIAGFFALMAVLNEEPGPPAQPPATARP